MNLKKTLKTHVAFIILLVIIATYLGVKAFPENGWDGWATGSSQTMMSSKHWVIDGFIYNKFLFLPMGYSKVVKYLDHPELRHLGRGIHEGQAVLIDQRSHYTHYPPGYLFPHALLMKIGFLERFWFRFLALFISFGGLIFMYCFFNLIFTKIIAFIAVLYYGVSTMFLNYADSLANQPVDDFFRFLIMFLSVWVYKIPYEKKKGFYNIIIWVLYFMLSISSYDSTLFIFVWLVGLDIINYFDLRKKNIGDNLIPWKKWLFFISAPVIAFIIQIVQNWWYLGWPDVWLDFKGIFLKRSSIGPGDLNIPGNSFLEKHIRSMLSPLAYMTTLSVRFMLPVLILIIVVLQRFNKKISINFLNFRLILLLFLAGSFYPFILTTPGYFDYSGRQFAPFIGLIIGLSIFSLIKILSQENRNFFREGSVKFTILFLALLVFTSFMLFVQLRRTYEYVLGHEITSNYGQSIFKVDQDMINFYRTLGHLSSNDSVIFYIAGKNDKYFTTSPISVREYYAGRLIFDFSRAQDLIKNYLLLKQYSENNFDAVIVSAELEPMYKISEALSVSNHSISHISATGGVIIPEMKLINNRYVLLIRGN